MERVSEQQIEESIANFNFLGRLKSCRPFGNGHINDTYLLTFEIGDMGMVDVILQRMDREVFTKPVELMENIVGVTSYLREKIIANGGDPERETLNIIPAKDVCGRAALVQKEIEFVLEHEDTANVFGNLLEKGEIPLRVTHNDTKLNNIMIDNVTRKGICVIDLDTVMPGLAMNDFGDSIRFGASTAAEDETDLAKVSCSMELFEIYVKGFLEGCAGSLTQREIELLPMGAKVMTYECGMRFLTDYLEGDHYFKISRENHNLDRARTQFKLVTDMEEKWETMCSIVRKYNS